MSDTFDGIDVEYFDTPSQPLERVDEDDTSSEDAMRDNDMLEAQENNYADRMAGE